MNIPTLNNSHQPRLNGKATPVPSSGRPSKGLFVSLRFQVGLLYVVLTLANLVFFSAIILENQMDVLNDNVVLQAERASRQIQARVKAIGESGRTEATELESIATQFGFSSYSVRDREGRGFLPDGSTGGSPPIRFREDLAELEARAGGASDGYYVRVNPSGFEVHFTFPLDKDRFLIASGPLETIKSRLRGIYWQLALALGWGVIFHVIFGIYLLRRIFRRIGDLHQASNMLSQGDLSRRTTWVRKSGDELDTLGDTFDTMAHKIEETVGTLSGINRRLRIELEIGRQVQTLFLRGHELVQEYQPAVVYQPVSEVSGDIYNFFKINDRFKGAFLADATGHGVSAALVTSVIFFHLTSLLKEERSPLKIMQALSRQIRTDLNQNFFATAFFLLLDSRGDLFYVNAGHNAPIVLRRGTGRMIELEATGVMLGLDLGDSYSYEMKRVPVRKGDRVLLYTDALVESVSKEDEMFGASRVHQILRETANLPGNEVVDELQKEVHKFSRGLTDDLTILVLDIP